MDAVTSYTPYSTTTFPVIPQIEIFYFVTCLSCFILGSVGNILALHFFWAKKKDVATITYIFICMTDLIISLLMLPHALPFVTPNRGGLLLEEDWFCVVWGILWYCSGLMAVFLVAVLSVTRTICITFPFANLYISKRHVVGVVVFYLAILVCQSSIPFWFGVKYKYMVGSGLCTWWAHEVLADYPNGELFYSNLFSFELYFLILPILLSCVVSLRVLGRREHQMTECNKSITTTILSFTGVYIVCNFPPCGIHLVVLFNESLNLNLDFSWDASAYFYFYFTVLSIAINSAINPLVYFWRIAKFREHVIALVMQWRTHGASVRPDPNSFLWRNRTVRSRLGSRGSSRLNGNNICLEVLRAPDFPVMPKDVAELELYPLSYTLC